MNIENFEELKEALYRKGFGTDLNEQLEALSKDARPEFVLNHSAEVDKDELSYRLHFRRSEETDKVYFNKYDLEVKLGDNTLESLEHTFFTDKLITAMEAYRMLKYGDLVAVNKNLFKEGEKYNIWLSIDTNGIKNDYGNYPVNSYHENYYRREPFNVKDELSKIDIPVKQLESPATLENIEKALKKANLVPVTIMLNGDETTGYIGVNPARGRVVLYDSDMKLIEGLGQRQENTEKIDNPESQKNTPEPEATPQNEEVKKKPQDNREVNWKNDKNHRSPHRLRQPGA
jgi:hypothetical protein